MITTPGIFSFPFSSDPGVFRPYLPDNILDFPGVVLYIFITTPLRKIIVADGD